MLRMHDEPFWLIAALQIQAMCTQARSTAACVLGCRLVNSLQPGWTASEPRPGQLYQYTQDHWCVGLRADVEQKVAEAQTQFLSQNITALHTGVHALSGPEQYLGWVQLFHTEDKDLAFAQALQRLPR